MKTIFYILLFAFVTVIISIWGLIREKNKTNDLLNILYNKAEKKIIKALKSNKTLSKKQIEKELLNLKASLFYSKNKLVVKDPSSFTVFIIGRLLEKGIIVKVSNGYTLK